MHRDVVAIRGPGAAYWPVHRDRLADGSYRWGAATRPPAWVRWPAAFGARERLEATLAAAGIHASGPGAVDADAWSGRRPAA